MKSSIKIDSAISGNPYLALKVYNSYDDLRDKICNYFVSDSQSKPFTPLMRVEFFGGGQDIKGSYSDYNIHNMTLDEQKAEVFKQMDEMVRRSGSVEIISMWRNILPSIEERELSIETPKIYGHLDSTSGYPTKAPYTENELETMRQRDLGNLLK